MKAEFPISLMCHVLKVQPSGFYAWLKRPESKRQKEDERLRVHIRASHKASRKTYGSPRVLRDLRADGVRAGRKRIARLMREEGLKGALPRKFKRTTDSAHDKPIAPNILNRKFSAVEQTNKVWVADITYIWTAAGWLYLAVVIDLFSRRVVGYAIDDHMRAGLVTNALNAALQSRDVTEGLMHHSDRGSQYAGDELGKIIEDKGIILSMSRRGNCWDNAVAESFFATIKKELIHRQYWLGKAQTISAVSDYIVNFYNRQRRHSSIGYVSPAEYERLTMMAQAA